MLLVSSEAQDGDRAALRTQMKQFLRPTKLTFYYHMLLSYKYDRTTSLAVYKLSKLLAYEQLLFIATGKRNMKTLRRVVMFARKHSQQTAYVHVHELIKKSEIIIRYV